MKVRVSVSFNHTMADKQEADRLIDHLKEDGRIASAIHMYGGDAISFDWERRRDRKTKEEAAAVEPATPSNVVPMTAAS